MLVFNFLFLAKFKSEEEKLNFKALYSLPYNVIFSLPRNLTFCSIILPDTALICELDLTIE